MRKKWKWGIPLLVIAVFCGIFLVYTGNVYPADPEASDALQSDDRVAVSQTGYGWFFDGPSEEEALVFYPGAKIDEIAYAPLLHRLAEQGMDACLVRMPFHLALFGRDRAVDLMEQYAYPHWYLGGHSLGGAMAAVCAAEHGEDLSGLILLAAYPTKELDDDLLLISIYGSEDRVLDMEKMEAGRQFAPDRYREHVLSGGNHAQFGDYGKQKGDGEAAISSEEQQKQTVSWIMEDAIQTESTSDS